MFLIARIFTPVSGDQEEILVQTGAWNQLEVLVDNYTRKFTALCFVDAADRSFAIEDFGSAMHVNERGAERLSAQLAKHRPPLLSQ